ncbi:DUF302 domain-containing protein [Calderihabitans maritimus]|uniref:DUF302 domain-containing protein n=1 Tax=Calderihabitans maritimus TaxID=1246530 RepID=A0A1Z5HPH2_9FIRM|nr:DUF302 domain-containing protein [Calderihabitans maritimus]GAW91180.1 hypothetical protein KKC1_03420 [Calderihabitans maritimus]
MFDYTVDTNKDFSQAITDLKQTLSEAKFGVLWELDVPEKLKEKGVEYQGKLRVLEVCNPHHAKKALETNIRVGYFLPCKIVVYVEDGRTKIGMVRPTALVDMLDDAELRNFASQVEKELVTALDKASKN